MIIRRFPVSVEDLSQLHLLPSVDELRPGRCPLCSEPAYPAGESLRIVGHGSYLRQVAGIFEGCVDLVIRVRRYLCRGCGKTISVLPDSLYPGRWYSAVTIVLSLTQTLLQGMSAARVRKLHTSDDFASDHRGWKTLRRWRKQLLVSLFPWLGAELGIGSFSDDSPDAACLRLRRLLGLQGARGTSPPNQITKAVRAMLEGSAHLGVEGWLVKRADSELPSS